MKTVISNMICIENPTEEVRAYAETLQVDNPNWLIAQRIGSPRARFVPKKLTLYMKKGNTWLFPFGELHNMWKYIRRYDYSLDFAPYRATNMQGGIELYDYQKKAVEALFEAKGGVLEAPCGSGKTQMGLALISRLGLKALWLTHTHKLLEQSKERCEKYFRGDFGTITEGEVNIGKDITFATVQTLAKVDPSVYENEFNVVVVDEIHRACGTPTMVRQFYKVLSASKARYKYGLSATLTRADGLIRTTYSLVGRKVYSIPESEVGNKIIRAKHEEVDIPLKYPILSYCDTDGMIDYTKLITMLSENDERTRAIVVNIVRNVGRKQLVLCHRVKMCERIVNMLRAENIRASLVVGSVKEDRRSYESEVIVATYALAKEGLDIPTLEVLHLATPQKNPSTTKQSVGRIERNVEGKRTPICFDYVDTDIPYCVSAFRKRKNILKK